MVVIRALVFGVVLAVAAPAFAQSAALPARIEAEIGLPGAGAPRFASLTVDLRGTAWAIDGCVGTLAGVCYWTSRVVLSDAERSELTSIVALVQQRMRCPPPRTQPGDPAFTIRMDGATWEGALPADPAQLGARTSGACAAAARLAAWLVSHFPASR